MALEAAAVMAAIDRLAAAHREACRRAADLLGTTEVEAQVIVGLVDGGHVTSEALQFDLDLSQGGAAALAERLARNALVSREPDPARPRCARLRLAAGAELELKAALAPLTDGFEAIAGDLTAERRDVVARYLLRLADTATRFRHPA
jgi:DNA-binding MarR family transcriptional regulator